MLHLFQKDFMPECDYSTSMIATGCCVVIRSAFRALMMHVLIFKQKQGMIHVLRCHFIAVFSKSSLAYTSTDLRLCRHKRPCLVYAEDALQMERAECCCRTERSARASEAFLV